jgi:RNA-directed DNA polymerase
MRNRSYEGKQRVTVASPYVSAPSAWQTLWKSIDWQIVSDEVQRQQVGIAKAAQEGRWGKVNSLQGILVRSRCARLLAVRRVTTNKGKRTPGVDGVLWNTSRKKIDAAMSLSPNGYKPSPLKRTYVPKKNGKRRPLGIPTMKDRAMQALFKLALEPVAESLADKKNIPMDKGILRKWLRAGYIEGNVLYPTEKGTPQGGLISPVLANMAGRPCRLKLAKPSCTTIRRHVKIRAEANVFNPDHADYFAARRQDQRRARQADYKRRKQWEREEAWEHAA